MGRPKVVPRPAASITLRRSRWELSQCLTLLSSPPTDHAPTVARLAAIAAEVRAELRRVAKRGGSFDAQHDAVWALLDQRLVDPDDERYTLRARVERHIASLDTHRKRWTNADRPMKLAGGGTLTPRQYYPVPGDRHTSSGYLLLVSDDALPAL